MNANNCQTKKPHGEYYGTFSQRTALQKLDFRILASRMYFYLRLQGIDSLLQQPQESNMLEMIFISTVWFVLALSIHRIGT